MDVAVDVVMPTLETQSLEAMELDVLADHHFLPSWGDFSDSDGSSLIPSAFSASTPFSFHRPFDLTKFPLSYSEAIARADAPVW